MDKAKKKNGKPKLNKKSSPKKGNSQTQTKANNKIVSEFFKTKKIKNYKINYQIYEMEVDGWARKRRTVYLVEAWAHQGKSNSGQKRKILTDVLKLAYLKAVLEGERGTETVKAFVLFADANAAQVLSKKKWGAKAAQYFKVENTIVQISNGLKKKIMSAQKVQIANAKGGE